jgi:hypothetical protein
MTRCACLSMTTCLLLAAPWAAASPTRAVVAGPLLRAPQEKAKETGKEEKGKVEKGEEKAIKQPAQKPEKLTPQDLQAHWEALVGNDAAKAYKSIWALVADPDRSVPFLGKHLQPVPAPEAGRLEKLLAALDSKRFTEREKAMADLEKMGAMAKAGLEKALKASPSEEKRRRLEKLLDKLSAFTLSGEDLRTWRALEALELVGNPAARQVLQRLAGGAPGVWQTEEARAALDRLLKRVSTAP